MHKDRILQRSNRLLSKRKRELHILCQKRWIRSHKNTR